MYIMCTSISFKSFLRRCSVYSSVTALRSVGIAAHMPNRFAILGDVIVTGRADSRNLQKALRGVPLSWVDLSACFRVGISLFCVLYAYRLYRPLCIPRTVLAGSPPCSAYLRLCMFVLWDGAELCDAFQFFCAVILCGDLHGFSNLCRELYAAAYVLRAAILYNIFVYSCCRQGGFTRRRERRSDSAVFCRGGSLLIAEFLSAPMFRYGGYFTLFSRLKFALLSAMKNLKFLKITAVMIG